MVCLARATIKPVRTHGQSKTEIEGVTSKSRMGVFFIVHPQSAVRIAQYPGADGGIDTSRSLRIAIEDVRQIAVLLGIIQRHPLLGMVQGVGEFTRPTAAAGSSYMSRDEQVGVACRLAEVHHLLHPW